MSEKKYPSELAERFQVRLPPGMRDRIAEAAKASGRSMNSEIVHRLEQSFLSSGTQEAIAKDPALQKIAHDAAVAAMTLAIVKIARADDDSLGDPSLTDPAKLALLLFDGDADALFKAVNDRRDQMRQKKASDNNKTNDKE